MPVYDLQKARDLVRGGRFSLTKRPSTFIRNRYDRKVADVAKEVFATIDESGFEKSVELENRPGVKADVYMTTYDDITWYVKFFIDNDKVVAIWSMNWDRVIH